MSSTLQSRLELGARVHDFFNLHQDLHPGRGGRRWKTLIEDHLRMQYTDASRLRVKRSWEEYCKHGNAGGHTLLASGGLSPAAGSTVKPRARQRRHYIRHRKMACLWFELLQWYVDEIEELRSRADSALLLAQARLIRDRLLAMGYPEKDIPKINADFLRRWRHEYGISIRMTTVRFKVSLAAATARVRVMLSNIFRLRRLWTRCHGNRPMRWLSFDQKPSWFNNAGLRPQYARTGARRVGAREDHAGTRQRYTVMTAVQSWRTVGDGGMPPKCAVLFKAASGTRSLTSSLMFCF